MDKPFELNVSKTAEHLGVSVGTVRRWANIGVLPHSRTPGGQRRFSESDLTRFVAAQKGYRTPFGTL